MAVDASNITKRLWVGSAPPFDRELPFDVLALCAVEIQPKQLAFRGAVIRCPIPDAYLTIGQTQRALSSGRAVGEALRAGRRVLVTCAAGLNRSSLVAGIGLGLVSRLPPSEIVLLMRKQRSPSCLHNPHFVEILDRYLARVRS